MPSGIVGDSLAYMVLAMIAETIVIGGFVYGKQIIQIIKKQKHNGL